MFIYRRERGISFTAQPKAPARWCDWYSLISAGRRLRLGGKQMFVAVVLSLSVAIALAARKTFSELTSRLLNVQVFFKSPSQPGRFTAIALENWVGGDLTTPV